VTPIVGYVLDSNLACQDPGVTAIVGYVLAH